MARETPPVLTYVDKGLGASILRAGIRLWDGGTASPVAAVKITRHNLYRPTSLIHETGHQVAHLLGWTDEFAQALRPALLPHAPAEVVESWMETSSEVVADIYAFVHCGYAAVAALHDVVAAEESAVLRYLPGDPHPIPYIRVLLNVEYCRRMYGAGPGDNLASAWREVHPLQRATPATRKFLERSLGLLPRLAELSLFGRMRAFGGRAIVDLVDSGPGASRRAPAMGQAVGERVAQAPPHWARTEPIRLLALSGYRMAVEPEYAAAITQEYETWTTHAGSAVLAA